MGLKPQGKEEGDDSKSIKPIHFWRRVPLGQRVKKGTEIIEDEAQEEKDFSLSGDG